jgi:hypothetical protein
MSRILLIVSIVALAAPRIDAEGLPRLTLVLCEGKEQVRPSSVADALGLFEDCVLSTADQDTNVDSRTLRSCRCPALARWVIREGSSADRERLWIVYDELDDNQLRSRMLDGFLDRALAEAIEESRNKVPPRPFPVARGGPGEDSPPPTALSQASSRLREAWEVYDSVTRAARERPTERGSEESGLSFQTDHALFQATLASFLRGRRPTRDTVEELARWQWGHWCGTGSGWFYAARARALAIGWLRLDRGDLAVKAAFGPLVGYAGPDEFVDDWDRALLQAGGVYAEPFLLGALLHGEWDVALPLARHASPRAAVGLLEALDLRDTRGEALLHPDPVALLPALGSLVSPDGECRIDDAPSRRLQRSEDAPPLAPALERHVLERLARSVAPGNGRPVAERAAQVLLDLCRPESRDVFDTMRQSPFFEVRRCGTTGLRALGESVPGPRPREIVAFRFLLDGRPHARQVVTWRLPWPHDGGRAETDDNGVLRIERDPFLDPKHPVEQIVLAAPIPVHEDDPWFRVVLSPPRELDALTTVSVETGRLTLVLPEWAVRPRPWSSGPLLSVERRPLPPETPEDGVPGGFLTMATSTRITFSRLQRGVYRAAVWHLDGTVLVTPHTTVGETPATAALVMVKRP